MQDLIEFSYWFRGFLGLMVAASATRSLWETRGEIGSHHARLLIVGITIVWAAEGLNRIWYSIGRAAGEMTAVSSPVVLVLAACIVLGAMVHLKTFTAMRCGFAAWWRISIGCAAVAAVLAWRF